MNTFELKPYENQKIKTFSQGMYKKAALVSVFLGEPYLIILDEPTNGLDTNAIIAVTVDSVMIGNAYDALKYALSLSLPSPITLSAGSLAEAAGGKLNINVAVPEEMKVPGKTINAYIALYSNDGRLVSLNTFEDVDKGSYSINIPADTTGMKLKAFLWDNEYMPLIAPVVLN